MKCLVCGGATTPFVKDLFDDRYGAPGTYTVYRCSRCGFGRLHPELKEEEIGQFYAKYYPLGQMTPEAVRAAVDLPPRSQAWLSGTDNITHQYSKPGAKVLDVGSASGVSLLEISALGGEAYGVEPDPNAARLAKELGLRVETGFLTDDPFAGTQFDTITASQVLEHAPDPKAFLMAVHDRLTKDGYAVLSFPNLNALYRGLFGRRWLHWHVPYHCNFFTRQSFAQLADQVGLDVISVRTITPNLWTIIQFRSLADSPEEGKMGSLWAAQHDTGRKGLPPPFVIRLFQELGFRVLNGLILVGNRLLDALGLGESFLVVVKAIKTDGTRDE